MNAVLGLYFRRSNYTRLRPQVSRVICGWSGVVKTTCKYLFRSVYDWLGISLINGQFFFVIQNIDDSINQNAYKVPR